jgi:sulfate permease, SulP family
MSRSWMPKSLGSTKPLRGDIIAGLVSSTVAIPLAMAFGMFAFVPLGDEYFAYGAMAGLLSAVIAGVSVHIKHDDGDIRLVTFAAGAVFGELALLDRGPRSATITVDEDLQGFGLSEASFAVLCREQPDIAIKQLTALGRELSVRIRYANLTIQQLET